MIDRRLTSLFVIIWPGLAPFSDDDPLVRRFAALLPLAPPSVLSQLRRREQCLVGEAGQGVSSLEPLPDPSDAIEALWADPDPDTALWVLWVQDRRAPDRAAALRRQPRVGLPDSPALRQLMQGLDVPYSERLTQLLQVPLGADLSPAALFSLLRWGDERRLEPGEVLFRVGDDPDIVAILLEGSCEVYRDDGEGQPMALMAQINVGEPIGEVSFFTDHPRLAEVRAGGGPATVLVFTATHFEELLQQSTEFGHNLLRQLSLRLQDLYAKVGPANLPR